MKNNKKHKIKYINQIIYKKYIGYLNNKNTKKILYI